MRMLLDIQLQGAEQRTKTTYKYIEPFSIEIYGSPNQYALDMITKVMGSGFEVSVKSQYVGGFMHALHE